ncbi:MAG: cystathionine beta-lyase [Bacilli bacterium]|nr:cystathionine beta-lyase [Bacilli bacterium]
MEIDFNQPVNRKNTGSMKWDATAKWFGETEVLPMWVADMDFMSPPPVIEALKQRVEHGVYGYVDIPDSYHEAIINWMNSRHGRTVERDWLVTSPGVVVSLGLLVQCFTEPGEQVVIQSPVYPPFFEVIRRNDRIVANNELKLENGRYTIDFADLEQKLSPDDVKMMILCSPHNPVGRVWTKHELQKIGDLCLKHNVLLVSDEIHADLVYREHHHLPIWSISDELAMNTITCISPGKTFNLPGLQTASLIIPNPKLRETFQTLLKNLFFHANNVLSITAADSAYRHGASWLDQLIDYVRGNLDFLLNYVDKHIPQIKVIPPEGTYLVWLNCRELGLEPEALHQFMIKEAKVAMNAGSSFGPGGEGFERINIACSRATLAEGLKRIEQAVKNLSS